MPLLSGYIEEKPSQLVAKLLNSQLKKEDELRVYGVEDYGLFSSKLFYILFRIPLVELKGCISRISEIVEKIVAVEKEDLGNDYYARLNNGERVIVYNKRDTDRSDVEHSHLGGILLRQQPSPALQALDSLYELLVTAHL